MTFFSTFLNEEVTLRESESPAAVKISQYIKIQQ